jgi:hypothetical protein
MGTFVARALTVAQTDELAFHVFADFLDEYYIFI